MTNQKKNSNDLDISLILYKAVVIVALTKTMENVIISELLVFIKY